ncbi:unnamed protein product, partial [Closterium sp. NIES-53]
CTALLALLITPHFGYGVQPSSFFFTFLFLHMRVLSLGVLLLLEVLRVPRHDCLPGQSLSPRSSCASGLLSAHALGVELPELEALLLEALELEVLELLVLEVPEVLKLLVLEVPVLGVLELPGLLVLGALELEELELETLELEALELEALALATLELEELKLETLALEALELLTLELEALCSGARFSFRRHRRLCRHLTRSFSRFLSDSPLPVPSPYAEQTGSFIERRELESRPALPVRSAHAGRRAPRPCPPPVLGTHVIALQMASWKSTGTYVDAVPPPCANIVDGMWIFRVKRPPGSLPVFKARYVARGFSQRQGFDFFHTFSPPGFTGSFPAITQWSLRRPVYGLRQSPRELHDTLSTTLAAFGFAPSTADMSQFLRTDTSLPPFYVLLYIDELVFATADTEALTLVKSELQKRHTCTDMVELRNYLGLHITRDRARRTIALTRSHMVHQVLHRFGFQYSSTQPTPLSTSHSLSAPPLDESVEPSGPILARYVAPGRHRSEHWEAAKRVLRYLCSILCMGLVLGGQDPVVLTGHAEASWVDNLATQRSSQGYTFSLGSDSVSWQSTRSSSILSFGFEAEIYTGAMAAQELRRLTYLLADLGERPRSSPVLYVDNKAMIALCEEHRVEHRTKHIALRYFLHRELQQRGQLRLAYVATRANTADIFTKALQSARALLLLLLLCAFSYVLQLLLLTAAAAPCCCCYLLQLSLLLLLLPTATAVATPLAAATATARMANFSVLTFDAEGRTISFDVWLNDLQLYLQRISLFVPTEGTLPAPATTAVEDHSKWLMRDATARLTVRNHLPVAERAHFSQQKTAKALYDAVVARYSSPATAALGRLMLPYLHPELADFHCL